MTQNRAAARRLSGGRRLRFVDMFCGIGGFHCAAAPLGMECVFACDIDGEVRKAYAHNFDVVPAADIAGIDAAAIPDHDIFCAGFPCQPFSIIGKRAGFGDLRGTLFFEIARILEAKRPRAVCLENVRQLVSHQRGETFAVILRALADLGYAVEHRILDARDFGLPQKRERVLLVGARGGFGDGGFAWPARKIPMRPLAEILESSPPRRFYASARIRESRRRRHQAAHRPAIWHENKGGNIASHPFSCALRAGASYNYLLVDGERRPTPRELLRLQGFPESFAIVCGDSQTRKQAGNAVPAPMAREVLRGIQKEFESAAAKSPKRRALPRAARGGAAAAVARVAE